jgi:hypothetical protein
MAYVALLVAVPQIASKHDGILHTEASKHKYEYHSCNDHHYGKELKIITLGKWKRI